MLVCWRKYKCSKNLLLFYSHLPGQLLCWCLQLQGLFKVTPVKL